MKRIFTNDMVAHVWAQQKQDAGRSNNGNFYFEGETIYSYGSHFPIAVFANDTTVLFTEETWSVSTSQHVSLTRRAIPDNVHIIPVPTLTPRGASLAHSSETRFTDAMQVEFNNLIQQLIITARNKRARKYRFEPYRDAMTWIDRAKAFRKLYKIKGWKIPHLNASDKNLFEEAQTIRSDAINAKRKRDAEKTAKERAKAEIDLKEWLACEKSNIRGYFLSKTYMRVNLEKDLIETTRGASFPIEHAKKAFHIIAHCEKTGRGWSRNGQQIRLGHFNIDKIEPNGNVTAGCHFVEFDQIKHCAEKLGLLAYI